MKKLFILFLIFLMGCSSIGETKSKDELNTEVQAPAEEVVTMELKSDAFKHGDMVPKKQTCDGDNASPKLLILGSPKNAKSLALIMDDPDAPSGTFVHWVAWNIPVAMKELPENASKVADVLGFKQGKNDARSTGYFGPCPPSGVHRYFFKLYALDTVLDLPSTTTKADLEKAMQGYIVAQAELMGKYKRQ